VVSVMYFAAPVTRLATRGGAGAMFGTITCCLLVIALSVWPGLAIRAAQSADPLLRQARTAVAAGLRVEPAAVSSVGGDQAGQLQKGGS